MSELQLKGWLLNALQGTWVDTISPGAGSTFGFPDVGMLVPGTLIYMPVELKFAEVRYVNARRWGRELLDGTGDHEFMEPAGHRVRPSRLRPSQIAWHDGFTRAGGYSRLMMAAFSSDGWDVWVIDRPLQGQLKDYKAGFPMGKLLLVTKKANQLDLDTWWSGPRAWWQEQKGKSLAALGQPRQASQELAGAEKGLPM